MVVSFREGLSDAIRGNVCFLLQRSQSFGSSLVSAWKRATGIQANPIDFAGVAYGLFCNANDPVFPVPDRGIQGADCQCDVYEVDYTLFRGNPPQAFSNGAIQVYGEITDAYLFPDNPVGFRTALAFDCRGRVIPGRSCSDAIVQVTTTDGSSAGDLSDFIINSVTNISNPGRICENTGNDDGLDLPEVGISNRFAFNYNPEINLPDVSANFTGFFTVFQPRINLRGELEIPIRITGDTNNIDLKFDLDAIANINTGDITFQFGGSSPATGGGGGNVFPPSPCEDNDEPLTDPPPIPSDDTDSPVEDPLPESLVISGVIVTTTTVPNVGKLSVLFQNNNPDIYIPSLGHINFYYAIGEDRIPCWSEDIKIKNRRQFVECPYVEGAKDVRGTPQQGVEWVLTPVYKRLRSQLPDR